jgi:hypothetical protein
VRPLRRFYEDHQMKDEALKLALEALENHEGNYKLNDAGCDRQDRAITAIKQALAAPVQEPVAWREFDGEGGYTYFAYQDNETWRDEYIKRNGEKYANWVEPLYTTPPAQPAPEQYTALEQALTRLQKRYAELEAKAAAQPAVPDAMTSADIQEHIEYVAGWNDCRAEMLKGMKP